MVSPLSRIFLSDSKTFNSAERCRDFKLSSYLKSFAAARAYDRVLSLCARQTKYGFALGTFAVNVSFSVTVHISAELEKSAELLVFCSALCDISRKHSGYEQVDKYTRKDKVTNIKNVRCQNVPSHSKAEYHGEYKIKYKHSRVAPV